MANALQTQVAAFLAEKDKRKSAATGEQYRSILERIWLPWCATAGITAAAECNAEAMETFVDSLRSRPRPLSAATVKTYVRGVRIFLNWCEVPKGKFEAPKEPYRMRDTLNRTEVDAMERVAPDERDRLIVRLLADTGIRVSELLGLREQDLREDSHARHYFIRVIGKGNKEREVGLSRELFFRLRTYAQTVRREYIFYARRRHGGDFQRLTRNGIDQTIRHLAKEAGITKRVWPHLLRHSFATHQIRAGKMNLAELQKTLGHSTLAMLTQIYNHVTADDSYDRMMAGLRS